MRQATDDDLLHIRGNAASYTDRLPSARKVRPVVRRPLPPAGQLFDDGVLVGMGSIVMNGAHIGSG